jgi:hypothetical protein
MMRAGQGRTGNTAAAEEGRNRAQEAVMCVQMPPYCLCVFGSNGSAPAEPDRCLSSVNHVPCSSV